VQNMNELCNRFVKAAELIATRCSCITILWFSLVSFVAITLCVASQRVFVFYFVIDSVRKLLVTPSYKIPRKVIFTIVNPCRQL
jgi:hypothetical protein